MKTLGVISAVVGFIVLLGTAGASDQNLITFDQTIKQAVLSLCVIVAGILLVRVADAIRFDKHERRKNK